MESKIETLFDKTASFNKIITYLYGEHIKNILRLSIEIGLLEFIMSRPSSLEEISHSLKIPLRTTEFLLFFLVNLELLDKRNGIFTISDLSKDVLFSNRTIDEQVKCLVRISPTYDYKNIKELLLKGRTYKGVREWGVGSKKELREFYTHEIIHRWRFLGGKLLAENFDFSLAKQIMDIGGASGGHCVGIHTKFPHLKFLIFDLPIACKFGRRMIKENAMSKTITFYEGDFFKDALPSGSDTVLLSHVMHDWNIEQNKIILDKIYHMLPLGGHIIVLEYLLNDNGIGPTTAMLQWLCVLLGSYGGRQLSERDITQVLYETGFREIYCKKNIDKFYQGIVVGRKI